MRLSKRILPSIFAGLMLSTLSSASELVPTKAEVAKLYVATFNRAPDSAGLAYWTNDSGLKLSQIAQSFFDQPETQTLYPSGTANSSFVTSVYQNLFNREPDTAGLNYWVNELDIGSFSKNSFIQAVINGAQDNATSNDASILANKTTVGLSFSEAGLSDVDDAKSIMTGVSDDDTTMNSAISQFGINLYSAPTNVSQTPAKVDLSGTISTDTTLTADTVWRINGLVTVNNGATLTIEAGTTIIGAAGTGANSSYMVIDKGAKIMAEGTADKHIVFTSETAYDGGEAAVGQWGSLVIIGNAGNDQVQPYEVNPSFVPGTSDLTDNSGVLKYVDILNSGITIEENKELNGLSLVAVGSGTTIDHVNVNKSDDDCIEIWGGTVDLSNVSVSECTDDQFDIDDGYSGTVTNLTITQSSGNAGIEMSGTTAATFDGLFIDVTKSAKEGGIYFKSDTTGGTFSNVLINYNTASNGYGAIHTTDNVTATVSFSDVTLTGSNTDRFTGGSATALETALNN